MVICIRNKVGGICGITTPWCKMMVHTSACSWQSDWFLFATATDRETMFGLIADAFLLPINSGSYSTLSTMPIERFVDTVYLPYAKAELRPSTYKGYLDIWENHLRSRCGRTWLRDFRTCNGQRLLADIARHHDLTRTSLFHIKNTLSAIFKHAKREGAFDGVNPMQDVGVPKSARDSNETYAYSLEQIMKMLTVLPLEATVAVAIAGFAGLRKGEIRGARWEYFDGSQLSVRQSVWNSFVTDPKRKKSKAPVPVIGPLAALLDFHRQACGSPETGYILAARKGQPLNLDNLATRVIKPAIEEIGLKWHGWHSFRRGLATNLYVLGIPDKTIQAILRHADLSTTMNKYVKSISAEAAAAMKSLENVICTQHAPALAKVARFCWCKLMKR